MKTFNVEVSRTLVTTHRVRALTEDDAAEVAVEALADLEFMVTHEVLHSKVLSVDIDATYVEDARGQDEEDNA